MGRRRCCCLGDCTVFSDDFDGDDSDDLTPEWDERSGDWERLNNELVENGNAGALIICQTETATEEQSVQVTGTRNAGDIVGAVCNYLDDSHYFYAEIEDIGPDTEVRLYRVPGGLLHSATVAQVPSPGGLTICFSKSSFSVLAGEAIVYDCNPAIHAGGKKGGIRNGGGNVSTFEAFSLENYDGQDANVPLQNPPGYVCCIQQCHCRESAKRFCIPRTLTMTFYAPGIDNGCGTLDGVTVDLFWDPVQRYWENATPPPEPDCAALLDWFSWILECEDNNPCDIDGAFTLRTSVAGVPCTFKADSQCLEWEDAPESFTCNPLVMTFEVKTYGGEPGFPAEPCGGCCETEQPGHYWIIITA